jgi:hypothetical protein
MSGESDRISGSTDGRSREELNSGFKAFRETLKTEYRSIKQREYGSMPHQTREIGIHAILKAVKSSRAGKV